MGKPLNYIVDVDIEKFSGSVDHKWLKEVPNMTNRREVIMSTRQKEEKILQLIDEKATIEFTQKLIQIPSVNPPGEEKNVAEAIAEKMKQIGLETKIVPVEKKRANVIGRIKGAGRDRRPALLLSGHLDTVPPGKEDWQHEPFSGKIDGNKIYGRGTADMKSMLASMVMAADALIKAGTQLEGDLIIAGTMDEEVSQLGARNLIGDEWINNVGAVLIGEPSSLEVIIAEKGAFWLEITTLGKTAHGSTPHLGTNAIMKMSQFLNCVKKAKIKYREHTLLGASTTSVGTIKGGVKINVVPDQCKVTIDIRTVPGQNHKEIIHQFEDILDKEKIKGEIRVINDHPPLETSKDELIVRTVIEIVQEIRQKKILPRGASYFTDGVIFVPRLQIPMVICGGGNAECAHKPDEYIEIPKLINATKIYALTANRFLSFKGAR